MPSLTLQAQKNTIENQMGLTLTFAKLAGNLPVWELEALADVERLERIHDRLLTATSWADLLGTP